MKIVSVELDMEKQVKYALCKIKGIGLSLSKSILLNLKIDGNIKLKKLDKDIIASIVKYIEDNNIQYETGLDRNIEFNIRKFIETKSYRGFRHAVSLPCNGQRTSTNSKTKKKLRKKEINVAYSHFIKHIKIVKNFKKIKKNKKI